MDRWLTIQQVIDALADLATIKGTHKDVFAQVCVYDQQFRVPVIAVERGDNGELVFILDKSAWP